MYIYLCMRKESNIYIYSCNISSIHIYEYNKLISIQIYACKTQLYLPDIHLNSFLNNPLARLIIYLGPGV